MQLGRPSQGKFLTLSSFLHRYKEKLNLFDGNTLDAVLGVQLSEGDSTLFIIESCIVVMALELSLLQVPVEKFPKILHQAAIKDIANHCIELTIQKSFIRSVDGYKEIELLMEQYRKMLHVEIVCTDNDDHFGKLVGQACARIFNSKTPSNFINAQYANKFESRVKRNLELFRSIVRNGGAVVPDNPS
ncbi:hypothetical protein G6700_05170 [Polynucleobacter paneuropaeus]|nr:hypothetical protein G6700_05170 [Polynucleobacter paneuropaeus]